MESAKAGYFVGEGICLDDGFSDLSASEINDLTDFCDDLGGEDVV